MGIRYNWQESSPIAQLDVAKNPSARLEATIFAPDPPNAKSTSLPEYLAKHGFICYLDEVDGDHCLKVVGFGKNEGHLVEVLKDGNFVTGVPSKNNIRDSIVKLSPIARLRKNAYALAGGFGDIGHLAMAVSGKLEGDNNRIATSALYGTAATIQALYGTGAGAIRFTEMVSDLRDYLAEKGVNLSTPLIVTPEIQYRQRNPLAKMYDFLKKHPVQISQGISFTGNISLFRSGINEIRTNGTGYGRLFAGAVTATSALIAMFMPEATQYEIEAHKKEKGVFQELKEGHVGTAIKIIPHRVHMFIARSPLAFQGILLLSDNMGMIFDAFQTNQKYKVWKEGGDAPPSLKETIRGALTGKKPEPGHQPSHHERIAAIDEKLSAMHAQNPHTLYDASHPDAALKANITLTDLIKQRHELDKQITGLEKIPYGQAFSWITAISYTTASSFNTISTKNRDKAFETGAVYDELYTYAANAILGLPKETQAEVIEKMAFYLATNRDVHVHERDIQKGVTEKLNILEKSPWLGAMVAVDTAGTAPVSLTEPRQQEGKLWMDKISETQATAPAAPTRQ